MKSLKGKDGILSKKLEKTLEDIFYGGYQKYDKAIILVDGNRNPKKAEKTLQKYTKKFEDKTRKIIFEKEIEEWITESLGIKYKYHNKKPSDALNEYLKNKKGIKKGYQKHHLPNYARSIDFGKIKNLYTYKRFIKALKCS